jgi:hypothetical protein
MNIKEATTTELKAYAYENIAAINAYQAWLRAIEEELALRNPPTEVKEGKS